jgi:hypothetical protein
MAPGALKKLNFKCRMFIDKHVHAHVPPAGPEGWAQRAADLADATRKVNDLVEWGNSLAGPLKKELDAVTTAAEAQNFVLAGRRLDLLTTELRGYYERSHLKGVHAVELARPAPFIGFADRFSQDAGVKKIAGLRDVLKNYHDAKAACAIGPNATEESLAQARAALQNGAEAFVRALEKTQAQLDEKTAIEAARDLKSRFAPLCVRADVAQVQNGVGANLLAHYRSAENKGAVSAPTLANALRKADAARDLLAQAERDAADPDIESRSFFELHKKFLELEVFCDSLKLVPSLVEMPAEDFEAANIRLREALRGYKEIEERITRPLGGFLDDIKRDDIVEGRNRLIHLSEAVSAAGRTVAEAMERPIEALSKLDPADQSKTAAKLLGGENVHLILRFLHPRSQVALLTALRADPSYVSDAGENSEFKHRQATLYKATRLDPDFVNHEEGLQGQVIEKLTNQASDRKALQKAVNEWPQMREPDRLKVIDKLVTAHCETMGFGKPKIAIRDLDDKKTAGLFAPDTKTISINRRNANVNSIADVLDTVFHENSHNWQMELVDRFNEGKIAEDDPLYTQAMLFAANEGTPGGKNAYTDGVGYKEQPQEAHSFRTGPLMARKLLLALDR